MHESIDVSGLTEEAVQTVEHLVNLLRDTSNPTPPNLRDPEGWSRRLRTWAANHVQRPIVIDDSRETIYAGQGE